MFVVTLCDLADHNHGVGFGGTNRAPEYFGGIVGCHGDMALLETWSWLDDSRGRVIPLPVARILGQEDVVLYATLDAMDAALSRYWRQVRQAGDRAFYLSRKEHAA